jgi:acyl-CoA synthetase (AMP-forming)/AMP-acid ligase II
MIKNFNIACRLSENASRIPFNEAVVQSVGRGYKRMTYLELEADSNKIASAMQEMGIGEGKRVAVFVPYGIDFISIVFALLKTKATIVLIDPGMGIWRMLDCLRNISPDGIVAIPYVHVARKILRNKFPRTKYNITVGQTTILGDITLNQMRAYTKSNSFDTEHTFVDDIAAIIYTSGSTGFPKGVEFTHGIFSAQIDEIVKGYGIKSGDIDLACFPLFGLFDLAMGVTAVIPNFDSSKPAEADPRKIIRAANECRVTQAFASPAIWNIIANYCEEANYSELARSNINHPLNNPANQTNKPDNQTNNPDNQTNKVDDQSNAAADQSNNAYDQQPKSAKKSRKVPDFSIPTLKRVISAGAPVSARLLQKLKPFIHPDGELFTPYGATEALPTASISATEILNETVHTTNTGGGVCVGKRFDSISWAIIEIDDEPITDLYKATILPLGQIGELIVAGSQVTQRYVNNPEANVYAKIIEDDRVIWHRMGDVGYLDDKDRFWFCGRKSQRVETPEGVLFTIPCESIFNQHPAVNRSALTTSPNGIPRVFIELHTKSIPKSKPELAKLKDELLVIAQNNTITKQINDIRIIKEMPVDVRHNVKINREFLATMK